MYATISAVQWKAEKGFLARNAQTEKHIKIKLQNSQSRILKNMIFQKNVIGQSAPNQ